MKKNKFNWNLYISLLCLAFIPTIYETVKIFFINSSETSLNVLSQIEWFDLIDEILITFLTIPLYAVLGKYKENQEEFKTKIFQSFIICLSIYFIFSIIVYVNALHLVSFMNASDVSQTVQYLRLETIAFMVGIIYTFFSVIFIIIGKAKYIYLFLTVKMFGLIISDFILIQKFGTFGVAYANILVNSLLAICSLCLILKENFMKITFKNFIDISFLKEWLRIGIFVGIQIFLDNWIYAIMVCKMVNAVSKQADYWIANTFIWSWLLVPCTCLADIIKKDAEEKQTKNQLNNYFKIIFGIISIWIISIPIWQKFFTTFMHIQNTQDILNIVLKLLPFYVFYLFAVLFDNIFYGLGKTQLNMIISLIVNIGYYGIIYILFKQNFFTLNLNFIIYMFGFGMIVHFIIGLIFFVKLKKNL